MLRPCSYANDLKPGMGMTFFIIFLFFMYLFQNRKQEKVLYKLLYMLSLSLY